MDCGQLDEDVNVCSEAGRPLTLLINMYAQLLWVILIGLVFALIIQSLSANLGVTTGKHQKRRFVLKKRKKKGLICY